MTTSAAVSADSGRHWADEGAWPVAPGVHRIPLPLPSDGLRAVNVYVLETAEGLTLVDGGWAIDASREVLERSLAAIDRTVADVRSFLVTHAHRDHYTQAVALRAETGARVTLGAAELPSLRAIRAGLEQADPHVAQLRRAGAAELARQWGRLSDGSSADLTVWEDPDSWLAGDLRISVGDRTLDALHTPGHTQGHYVFAETGAGLLFAGDHVLPTITPSIGFEAVVPDQPLGDFLGSLAKVRALPDLALLPAHGPVAASTHARVDELLAHHDHRLTLCLDAFGEGAELTAHDVAAVLPWTRHEHALRDLDVFNAALATMETRAHLELLVARGRLARDEVDGTEVYRNSST